MSTAAEPIKRVALLMDRAYGYNRDVIRGIQGWISTECHWTVHHAAAEPIHAGSMKLREHSPIICM